MSGTCKTSSIRRFFVGTIYVMTKIMEIMIEKGTISDNHKSNNLMRNKGLVQNLNFKDNYAIAKYDKSIVAAKLKTSWNNKPISVFNLRYFTKSIIGKTWHVLLIYLVLYYIVQVLYQVGYFTNFCKSYSFFDTDNDIDNHIDCQVMIHAWFTHWGETERMMLSCVTFMLGFFVNHVVKRWWDQIIKVPTIEPIIICLSGFVWPNKNENGDVKSMEIFRKNVLRYCILSWAMAFRRFSNLRKKLCNSDDFILKGLLTSDEFSLLSKNGKDEIWWADRWWVPLIWATNMVNKASNQSQIVPKDAKELIAVILRYQKDLEVINKHVDNQTPILYSQAVRVSVWSFLIFGTVSGNKYILNIYEVKKILT